MNGSERASCTAFLIDTGARRSAAELQVTDGERGVVRRAGVAYAVSVAVPNAAEVLAAGLRACALAWKRTVRDWRC